MAKVRRLTLLLAPLSALLALVACAPAATGTTAAVPYSIGSRSIQGTPGTTLYVQAEFKPADFSLDTSKLTGAMWVPTGYDSDSAVITAKFRLEHIVVPAGWKLDLVQVQVTRSTSPGPTTFSKSSTDYGLTALVAITPKDGAIPGPYHLQADLGYQQTTKPLRIDLRIG